MRGREEVRETARTDYPQSSTSLRVTGSYRLSSTQSPTPAKLLDLGGMAQQFASLGYDPVVLPRAPG